MFEINPFFDVWQTTKAYAAVSEDAIDCFSQGIYEQPSLMIWTEGSWAKYTIGFAKLQGPYTEAYRTLPGHCCFTLLSWHWSMPMQTFQWPLNTPFNNCRSWKEKQSLWTLITWCGSNDDTSQKPEFEYLKTCRSRRPRKIHMST